MPLGSHAAGSEFISRHHHRQVGPRGLDPLDGLDHTGRMAVGGVDRHRVDAHRMQRVEQMMRRTLSFTKPLDLRVCACWSGAEARDHQT